MTKRVLLDVCVIRIFFSPKYLYLCLSLEVEDIKSKNMIR